MKFPSAILLVLFGLTDAAAAVFDYPWPASAPRSSYYAVKISQGAQATTMTALVSKPSTTAGPEGTGVNGMLTNRTFSYVPFAFTGEIDIEVTKLYGGAAGRVEISPKAYGIEPYFFDGATVRFRLSRTADRPAYLSVNFVSADNQDDDGNGGSNIKHGLMLFGDEPETDVPDPAAPGVVRYSDAVTAAQLATADVIYFAPGDYDLRTRYPANPFKAVLPVGKDRQRVYAAGGAYIRGTVHGQSHDGVRVDGRGVFTGTDLFWHEITDATGDKTAFMNFLGSDNCTFDGIMLVEATHHSLPSSANNTHRRVKIVGWAYNNDGIRPSSGALAENIFIKTDDDYDYARDPHEFRNSVIWPMRNGAFGQLGWNDLGSGGAVYRNIYFINAEWNTYKRNSGVMGSDLNQGIHLSGDMVENIYAENFTTQLANLTIVYDSTSPWNPALPGEIDHFTFRNVIFENPMQAPNGATTRNPIRGFTRNGVTATIHDIQFVNVVAGSTLVTAANAAQFFDIDPATTANISFTTSGPIYTVTATAGPGGTVSPAGALPTPAGMDRAVAIVANAGYRIADVVVDGVSQGRRQNVTFPAIAGNHTVAATFAPAANDYFDATPVAAAPTITVAPLARTVAPGGSVTLTVVAAGGGALSYQWYRDGAALAGATEAAYPIARMQATDAGSYTVAVANAAGTTVSAAASLALGSAATPRLADLSTRGQVLPDDGALIAGFVIAGAGPRALLIRGVGPGLATSFPQFFSAAEVLADPMLTLWSGGNAILSNDNWSAQPDAALLAEASARAGAFPLASGSSDAALLVSLAPGLYTAQLAGNNGGRGVGLVELYDLDAPGTSRLVSLSTRGSVGTGSAIMIPGIIVADGSRQLLIRGVGPGLANTFPTLFATSAVLPDPILRLVDASGATVATNDNWGGDAATISRVGAQVGAFALASGSADAAVVVTLPPGAYTALVADTAGRSGIALVEVYEVP